MRKLGCLVAVLILAGSGWALLPEATGHDKAAFFTWGKPGRTKPSTFDRPRCISVAPDGTLYVLDLTGRIQHFKPDGTYLDELQMPDVRIGRPQGVDVGPQGFIYVADTHYNQVVKFAPSGKVVLTFGEEAKDHEPGKLFWPCAIVVDADGTIYTAEYGGGDRIQVWTPQGKYLRSWGRFGTEPGEFMRPAGLAIGPGGLLYVADAANHRVQVFSKQGDFVRTWGGEGLGVGQLRFPYDIAVDRKGRVYTVEYAGHRVQCFSALGASLGVWGKFAARAEGLSSPWGLDCTPTGTVFVADTNNCRVVRVPLVAKVSPAKIAKKCRELQNLTLQE